MATSSTVNSEPMMRARGDRSTNGTWHWHSERNDLCSQWRLRTGNRRPARLTQGQRGNSFTGQVRYAYGKRECDR